MINKPFDPTKPVQTRAGHPARILCTDFAGSKPIVAVVTWDTGQETVYEYKCDGKLAGLQSGLDLVNVPERKSTWRNVYQADFGSPQSTQQQAVSQRIVGDKVYGQMEFIYEDNELIDVVYHRNPTE